MCTFGYGYNILERGKHMQAWPGASNELHLETTYRTPRMDRLLPQEQES